MPKSIWCWTAWAGWQLIICRESDHDLAALSVWPVPYLGRIRRCQKVLRHRDVALFWLPQQTKFSFFTTSCAKKHLKWMALLGNLEMLPRLWFTPTLYPLTACRDVINTLNASRDWLPKSRHRNSCLDNYYLHAGTPQASFIGVKECFHSDWDGDVRFVVLLWKVTQI